MPTDQLEVGYHRRQEAILPDRLCGDRWQPQAESVQSASAAVADSPGALAALCATLAATRHPATAAADVAAAGDPSIAAPAAGAHSAAIGSRPAHPIDVSIVSVAAVSIASAAASTMDGSILTTATASSSAIASDGSTALCGCALHGQHDLGV